jgi:hypothetical protein
MLSKYTWGLGIEHEMHIFHKPINDKNNIKDFILFNSKKVIDRIMLNKQNGKNIISDDDYEFLKSVPFETSGRKCNDKWVIKRVPVEMPEFITWLPFCSYKKNRYLLNMTLDIVREKERFYNILMTDKLTQKYVKKYGELSEYPFGMTRYLKCPIEEKNGNYIFEKNKNGKEILLPEYNGSYHITFTLPYTDKTTNNEFIKMHQNFANQLQWLEPLLLTAYFSGDEHAPGSIKSRVRGSFRVMIIGWGNFAGSDVRLFDKGIGRYAKTPTYWRKNLNFEDVDKLKPCYEPSPAALREKGITSLSSDFRTFGSTDPLRPEHRESGIGMTKPNGIEFRIFDHFSDKYITNLLMLVSLVAENSRITKTKGYVYENKIWIDTLHNIMKNGYKTHLSNSYIKLLREKLGLKIKTKSIIAYDIFVEVYTELLDKNMNGLWSKIFNPKLSKNEYNSVVIPQINKKAWQFAFMVKLNRSSILLHKFNLLSQYLNHIKNISIKNFKYSVIDIFGNNWINDIEDIAYFYETLKYAKIEKNKNCTIKNIKISYEINFFENFNNEIIDYFGEDYISNIF